MRTSVRTHLGEVLKNVLRALLRPFYRLLKPFVRPIAFRFRQYLINGLETSFNQIQGEIIAVRRETRMNKESVDQLKVIFKDNNENIFSYLSTTNANILQELIASQRLFSHEAQLLQKRTGDESQFIKEEIQKAWSYTFDAITTTSKNSTTGICNEINEFRNHLMVESKIIADQLKSSFATNQEVNDAVTNSSQMALNHSLQMLDALRAFLSVRLDVLEIYGAATARRIALNCGNDEVLVKTEVGYLICAASDHAVLACLVDTGDLERGTRIFIEKFLKPGDTFIDVGANIGIHTLAAARAMRGQGSIIAVEPFEPTIRLLQKSLFLNGFSEIVKTYRAAASNSIGQQRLHLGNSSGHHSLFSLDASSERDLLSVDVPTITLDQIIDATEKIDLIKIDVEGAELQVIEGATATIRRNHDVGLIVEFGPSHLRRVGGSTKKWIRTFRSFGFDFFIIDNMSGSLEKSTISDLDKVESVNLFFARPNSRAWSRIK